MSDYVHAPIPYGLPTYLHGRYHVARAFDADGVTGVVYLSGCGVWSWRAITGPTAAWNLWFKHADKTGITGMHTRCKIHQRDRHLFERNGFRTTLYKG